MIPDGLGHRWGECLIHEPTRTCYLNIPKCASTSMKAALTAVGFVHVEHGGWVKPPGWFTFTIWRDRLDRYRSGTAEAMRRGATYDEHTIPQHEFLHPDNPVDQFIEFDRLNTDVPRLLATRGIVIGPIPHHNVTEESP